MLYYIVILPVASLIDNLDIRYKLTPSNCYIFWYWCTHFAKRISIINLYQNITVSFRDDIGKKTVILGDNGKIILENVWNSEKPKIEIVGKTNKILNFENQKNIYSLEIENISKDIIDNKNESSFPGINKKEILFNTKLINSWINE